MNAALKKSPPVERNSFRFSSLVDRTPIRLPITVQTSPRPLPPVRHARIAHRPHRSGISLIEVLIAVFVLTFGLMGIAMVIPAGRYLMVEAAKSDRGSACGRAALNDMKLRGWLLPGENGIDWVGRNSGGALQSVFPNGLHIPYGAAFAIDPLFYAAPANSGNVVMRYFPYRDPTTIPAVAPETVVMARVTIASGATILPFEVADRILTWQDDVIFSTQEDRDRPRLVAKWDNGDSASFPNLPGDKDTVDPNAPTNNYPLIGQVEGKFSWLATVVPVLGPTGDFSIDSNGDGQIDEMRQTIRGINQYEVSIVVFYSRDLYCPAAGDLSSATPKERSVYARIEGGGIGGGDVYLMSAKRDWLELRKNSWIMLKGQEIARQIGNFNVRREVFKWYRVVNVDDVETGVTLPDTNLSPGFGRYVTLAGPDWQVDTQPPRGTFEPDKDIAEAAIIDDVVGVYTTIVDVNSL